MQQRGAVDDGRVRVGAVRGETQREAGRALSAMQHTLDAGERIWPIGQPLLDRRLFAEGLEEGVMPISTSAAVTVSVSVSSRLERCDAACASSLSVISGSLLRNSPRRCASTASSFARQSSNCSAVLASTGISMSRRRAVHAARSGRGRISGWNGCRGAGAGEGIGGFPDPFPDGADAAGGALWVMKRGRRVGGDAR
ncbi:hypothetical protein [Roseateles chitinivorans]|uniref:hypothetical protein n=1 Tax=Roseateles chitinivorans TaxID=2917965 RepID=UPI003D674489